MILTGGLGRGGGLAARGFGAWVGWPVEQGEAVAGPTAQPDFSVGSSGRHHRLIARRRKRRKDEDILFTGAL